MLMAERRRQYFSLSRKIGPSRTSMPRADLCTVIMHFHKPCPIKARSTRQASNTPASGARSGETVGKLRWCNKLPNKANQHHSKKWYKKRYKKW